MLQLTFLYHLFVILLLFLFDHVWSCCITQDLPCDVQTLVVMHWLNSCVRALICPKACRILVPPPRIKPTSLALEGDSLPLDHQGVPLQLALISAGCVVDYSVAQINNVSLCLMKKGVLVYKLFFIPSVGSLIYPHLKQIKIFQLPLFILYCFL